MKIILDASALLAWMQDEPGSDQVEAELAHAAISSLNWSEVLQKSIAKGVDITGLQTDLEALGLLIVPFDASDAQEAAQFWEKARNLSLADRACLALGIKHQLPVWTTDRLWTTTPANAIIYLLR